jgi:DNA-binding PadR family transcriptional regulator
MLSHLVLGLLRDGTARHGYGLILDLKSRTGRPLASGNLYRELARLAAQGLVAACDNVASDDPRRVPYCITDAGRETFDRWLTSPKTLEGELEEWLTFLDRVPPDALGRLLDRQLERLWACGRQLADVRVEAASPDRSPHRSFAAWLSLRTRRTAADVEFVQELHDRLAGREHVCPYRRVADSGDGAPEQSEARTHALAGSRSVLRLARGGAAAAEMKAHR